MDLLHAAFEHSPDVLMVVQAEADGEFRFLRVNTGFVEATGFSRAQVEGVRLDDLLPPEDAERLAAEYRRCLVQGEVVEFEQPFEVPSGQRTWHVRLRPMGPPESRTLAIAARDITWSRNFAQQLTAVAAYIPGFVYQLCLTPEGRWTYTFVGERAESMFGVPVGEALEDAGTLIGLIHPEDIERVICESLHAAEHLTPWHSEFRMFHRDGRLQWVEAHDQPQKLGDGTILWTGYVNDITERKALEASLLASEAKYRQLAQFDPVTGLANRTEFFSHLNLAIQLAERQGQTLALLFIDLDRFKPINDVYGHATGDALLRQVGERLRAELRGTDLVARIGGDEFTVLLQGPMDSETAQKVAEKLCDAMAIPFPLNSHPLSLSASIGVALYPDHGQDTEALTHAADEAMYHAKAAGRGIALCYSPHGSTDGEPVNNPRIRD
ncbi:GGDEF domain-containing protein [Halomonas sp. JS92-SW72]|uniref:GGDEF domain-containing protein n=1 Tax=Halomonas sp. JS92-SW72 TaxID=2306583 RepID=UPI0013C31E75|nr:GGDEF domain-containing protein [Halomonas sp. JS92-SW72]